MKDSLRVDVLGRDSEMIGPKNDVVIIMVRDCDLDTERNLLLYLTGLPFSLVQWFMFVLRYGYEDITRWNCNTSEFNVIDTIPLA